MASLHDVAAAVIESAGPVDHMKLQKLLYYVQGWSLAWLNKPMFPDDVEAWRYGPMVEDAYQEYKGYGDEPILKPESGDSSVLERDEKAVLKSVLRRYGTLTGLQLSMLTHRDAAWLTAWGDRGEYDRGRQTMQPESIVKSLREGQFGGEFIDDDIKADEELLTLAAEGDGAALEKLLTTG